MHLLSNYINKTVTSTIGCVVLVLLGIEIFMESIGQLSVVNSANYGLEKAFLYVLTQLPADLYQLFPTAGFLGCFIGLESLASSNQLIVMQAVGVSIVRLIGFVAKAITPMIVVITFIGEFIAPQIELKGKVMKSLALSQTGDQILRNNAVWLRDKNAFIHIGVIDSKYKIRNVSCFQFNQNRLISATFSPEGYYKKGHWTLCHANQSFFTPTQIRRITMSQMPFKITFNLQLRKNRSTIGDRSIISLYYTMRCCSGLQTNTFAFYFWQRITQPLTTMIMIFLGIPFVFGSFRQYGMGSRVLTGIAIGFTFYILNRFLEFFSVVYQLSPILIILMPTILFTVVYIVLQCYLRR
ncbi:LPS export ABC transporter permease LptG [Coxiella-like endosymbiont of Amblyomma americanum]|uniref:LPS export ABC transporter permease LptG n=1 Tax=Coxiella-like endosymbiont of Amblyomma americanum TaxID=1987500 RepID=UPI000F89D8CE|nr:LPS export ABC transporter permease LptG [Coxiella-like endosymbiont of Amblyomma americanum]AUJ58881.1 LPS export ABC transporter permease LptG [Coxiella-like endosymbiont of Amblyomma americanum]